MQMRIVSVDLGWRTLAVAKLSVSLDAHELHEWDLVDMICEDDLNINKTTLEDLITRASPCLSKLVDEWASWLGPDNAVVYLEAQPLGPMACNVKTKTLSHVLQALLLAKRIRVAFISPKLKLRGLCADATYTQNKAWAVKQVAELLTPAWLTWFEARKHKKDDLADALLQGYIGAKDELTKKPKVAKVAKKGDTKKRRRAHDTATEALGGDEL